MYCTKCGEKIPMLSKFCTKCGHEVSESESAVSKGEVKPRRFRALKIAGLFVAILIVLIAIPFIGYLVARSPVETYTHPTAKFSFVYPKSLKVETPTLPPAATCKTAAPCVVVLKDPAYNDYVVNWLVAISAADAGLKKEKFVTDGTKSFQVDVDKGVATVMTIGDKKVYKYMIDPAKPPQEVIGMSKVAGADPSLVKTMYTFFTNDAVVVIFFQAPPAGASANYGNFLNIQSLIVP